MPKYRVEVPLCGYSRGYQIYEVSAESKEDAEANYLNGYMVDDVVVRDDRERDDSSAEATEMD